MNENETTKMEKETYPEKPDYEKELIALVRSQERDDVIRDRLTDYHDCDIADILDDLTLEERRRLYHIMGVERTAELFTYLEDEVGAYIDELESETAVQIIEAMDADEAVDVLDELEDDKSEEIYQLLNNEAQQEIDMLHSYDDDQIGSRMSTNFVVIPRGYTVKQAMRSLVEQAADHDNITTIYVVNEDDTFFGALNLKDLIIARDYDDLESLMVSSYPYVYANENIDDCIEDLKDYSEDSIPVLDNDKKIVGVITAQDIVEVVDDEMGEDYAKLAGLTAEEDLKEPLLESMKKRLPWLVVLMFLGMIVSSVTGMFEQVMEQLTIVVAFQSMILGMAGNVGTQSLAVTIRVLMDENLTGKQKLELVGKEMRLGFVNGLLLGVLAFIVLGIYIIVIKGRPAPFAFAVSACIGVALMVAMVISSGTGTAIPLFLNKIKIDPAVASGPLISTVNDLVAVLTYYSLTGFLLITVMGF